MNFMQHQQPFGGVGQHQVPQTTAVGGHNYTHGSSPVGLITGPPPLAQPPGPPPIGSGGIRLGPSPGLPLQNNGQIPQGSKLATYMRRQGYQQQPSQPPTVQGNTLLGSPQGTSLHNASLMHGPPPHENSERSLQGVSNSIPPNHGPTSNDMSKTFSGLSLSSSSASLDGITSSTGGSTTVFASSTQLKKLSLSGIQEFVPSSTANNSPLYRSGSHHEAFNTRGSNSSLNPPTSSAVISTGNSPRQSPTPGSAPASHNQTSVSIASSTLPGVVSELSSVGESGDVQAVVTTATLDSSTAINAYNDGGTMYFYSGDELDPSLAMGNGVINGANVGTTVLSPNFTLFTGTPTFVANMRARSNAPANVAENETKVEILKRQQICLTQVNPEMYPEIPSQVDNFTNLCPLENFPGNLLQKSHTFGYVTTVYKATNIKESVHVAMRRVQNFKLVNSKCMVLVEQWRKLTHSNIVALRQVFTTKEFGDQSIIFVYDLYPGAETLMAKHFTNPPPIPGNPTFMDPYGMPVDGVRQPPYGAAMPQARNRPNGNFLHQQNNGMLPEPLIWTYVVQLTSALRTIHQGGLACRTLDPSKILVTSRARLLLNCCGMFDVLTFDPTASNPMAAMAHYQQEDLIALGKIVLALACNSFMAIQRENLQASMEIVTSTYSSDMRNLIMYLLTNPSRIKSVNDLMPMIGARFYDAIDESNIRNDILEADLAKDIESTRLFRLLTKLCTVVDRADLNGDASWSEYGDRYMLKLFRDYIFHQVLEDGRPFLDMAHVISCLNKFDGGVSDKICLMSRDEQNVLVVAYSELKICLEQSYAECLQSARSPPSNTAAAMAAAAGQSSAVGLGMMSGLSSTQYLG